MLEALHQPFGERAVLAVPVDQAEPACDLVELA